jgi:exodeoxyribonuclease VII small subunit
MSKKKTETTPAAAGTPAFEQALTRLETIVKEMESGALSLEQMMAHFVEGQGLIKVCSAKLNQVERQIEILVKEGDTVTAEPFDAGDDGADEPAANGDTDELSLR